MKYSKWQSWLQSVSRIISDACSVHCFELMENHRNCFFVYFHTIAPTAACTYAWMSAFNQSKRVYIVWRQTYVYVLGGGRWILNCDIEDITNDYVAAINKLHQLWENIFELQLRAFPLSILSNIYRMQFTSMMLNPKSLPFSFSDPQMGTMKTFGVENSAISSNTVF